jgi:Uma2 family endonuclease
MSLPGATLLSQYRTGDWISEGDFGRLCSESGDLRLERTAEGTLVMMSPAGSESGGRNIELTTALNVWAKQDGRGKAFDCSTGFTLPNGAIRSPDASWVEWPRWNALTRAQQKVFAPICPDFVAELRSESDSKKETQAKMREYLEQGARLGWLIDPLTRTVEIYRPDRPVEVLERPTVLSGEDVLDGFVLDLGEILYDEARSN